MADLASEWESAKPVALKSEWDKATPIEPTAKERGGALLGGINRGIAGLGGMLVDTAENAVNLGIAGYGATKAALTGKPGPDLVQAPGASRDWAKVMESIGIGTTNPRPDDAASRMLNTAGVIAGGSALPGASAKGVVTSAAGGALAGELIGPEWVGLGSMAPAVAGQTAAGIKNAVAAKAAPIVDTFKQAGTMPSVGQATDNVFLHGLENLAAKFPGGSGIMKSFIEKQQKQMGDTARTGTPTEAAGRAIESGIKGDDGFLARTKDTWKKLDDAVAAKIPAGASFKPDKTLQALDELTAPVAGAEKTTGALVNPKIQEMRTNLADDLAANNGQVPFEALRALRSKVGSMLDNAMVSGIPGGELKKVYGALSKDLESAANQSGAGREFARQNNYYRARMGRVEDVLDRVIGSGKQPEDIFKALNPTDPDQANKVRSVMRSLEPTERQVVSEAVANRLGRATPGKQNEYGEVFSSETFLTNWNKLSPGAKMQFFPDPPLRENIEKLSKAASMIRNSKGIYANPSGTAGSFAAYSVYSAPIVAVAAGSVAPVVAAAGAAGSAFIGAKMLTNPKVVEWLAKPINPANQKEAAFHLARLGVIYNSTKDAELKQELAKFMETASASNQ